MPVERITVRKIKDFLRLKLDAQISHERLAASLGISKGVVTIYVTLAAAAKLDWWFWYGHLATRPVASSA